MAYEIIPIYGRVANCYIIKNGTGFFMVDTGFRFSRKAIDKALVDAVCLPGDLKLIVITHADTDHTGNCVYLRQKHGVKIAAHHDEARALEMGDMLVNRRTPQNRLVRTVFTASQKIIKIRFQPDILFNDGDDLSPYGLNAKIIHTPGHTVGSISVLTAEGDFFCGDFLNNSKYPKVNTLVDDSMDMANSVLKIKDLNIVKVYPGHGRPFAIGEFWQHYQPASGI